MGKDSLFFRETASSSSLSSFALRIMESRECRSRQYFPKEEGGRREREGGGEKRILRIRGWCSPGGEEGEERGERDNRERERERKDAFYESGRTAKVAGRREATTLHFNCRPFLCSFVRCGIARRERERKALSLSHLLLLLPSFLSKGLAELSKGGN
jgi:hypothetical protein